MKILDYWRKIYKDLDLGIDERNRLLDQIRETYLKHEALLQHFNYDINMSTNDDDNQSSSSEETLDQDISPEINKEKRKAEEPIDPEIFGTWGDREIFDFIQTNEVKMILTL